MQTLIDGLAFSPDPERLVEQEKVAKEIAEGFEWGKRVMFLSAPTGNGKTLTAELVRRELDARMLYCCSDKELQRQFRKDFTHAEVLFGKSNYPTLDHPDQFPELACDSCNMEEGDCSFCSVVIDCPYRVAKRNLQEPTCKVVATNTSYLLAESGLGDRSHCRTAYRDELLVLDEGDRIIDELLSYAELRISPQRKKQLGLPDVEKVTVAESWVTWCEHAIPLVKAAYSVLPSRSSNPGIIKRRRGLVELHTRLKDLLPELASGNWILTGYDKGGIVFKPILATEIAPVIFGNYRRVLLMSASFISPSDMADELGVSEYGVVSMEPKIPVSARPVIVCPVAEMKFSNKAESFPLMVEAVEKIMSWEEGRGLIHTVSYELAKAMSYIDSPRIRWYANSTEKEEVVKWFKETPGAVIIAPSMERGVDLPDEMLRWMVIAKLPFPNLGDKQVNARLHSRNGSTWYRIQTIRSLVQMCGRGSRHADDFCRAYVIDKQLLRLLTQSKRLFPRWWMSAVEIVPWKVVQARFATTRTTRAKEKN